MNLTSRIRWAIAAWITVFVASCGRSPDFAAELRFKRSEYQTQLALLQKYESTEADLIAERDRKIEDAQKKVIDFANESKERILELIESQTDPRELKRFNDQNKEELKALKDGADDAIRKARVEFESEWQEASSKTATQRKIVEALEQDCEYLEQRVKESET